jgi:hypothetical protein
MPCGATALTAQVECLYACISPRFTEKYETELEFYFDLRDSIADYKNDFQVLQNSSRAVTKLSKVVRTS